MVEIQTAGPFSDLVDPAVLVQAAELTLRQVGAADPGDLTIVITTEEQVQSLNRVYRAVDASTDVLAFPAGDLDPETGRLYLGDVIISFPHAQVQASEGGYPVKEELQLLVVHGVLHLLGYDHLEQDDQTHMWAVQETILVKLSCRARPEAGTAN